MQGSNVDRNLTFLCQDMLWSSINWLQWRQQKFECFTFFQNKEKEGLFHFLFLAILLNFSISSSAMLYRFCFFFFPRELQTTQWKRLFALSYNASESLTLLEYYEGACILWWSTTPRSTLEEPRKHPMAASAYHWRVHWRRRSQRSTVMDHPSPLFRIRSVYNSFSLKKKIKK